MGRNIGNGRNVIVCTFAVQEFYSMRKALSLASSFVALLVAFSSKAQQDTIVVQTLTFDSTGRNYNFTFPDNPAGSYQKILMQYRMRCKGALISDGANRNKGCGEWDYSSNTFITDSSLVDSTKQTHASHEITGFSGTSFDYRNTATYDLLKREKKKVVKGNIQSENNYIFGSAASFFELTDPDFPANKIQMLYTAQELTQGGFTAGPITGLSFFAKSASGKFNNFRVRIKETTKTGLTSSAADTTGFTEVYYYDYSPVVGENRVDFYQNFTWSGTSALLIEFSFDAATPSSQLEIRSESVADSMAIAGNSGGDINFNGLGSFDLSAMDLTKFNQRVTFAFWSKGDPAFIPSNNTTIFEGVDANGNRQANVHHPWSDENIYWDCGGKNGGYDRTNKKAQALDYASNWHHWVFSKDAVTGRLNIYKDGGNYQPSGNKTSPVNMTKLRFGGSADGSLGWYGNVDRFQMFDTSSTVAFAKGIYTNDKSVMDVMEPYRRLDIRGTRTGYSDEEGSLAALAPTGIVNKTKVFGGSIFRNLLAVPRPQMNFYRTQFSSSNVVTETSYDTLPHSPKRIISYAVSNNKLNVVDTTYGYNASVGKVYDESGSEVETRTFTLDKNIQITTLNYYYFRPQRLELMSFVTPYGINLDLGVQGKMWEYDVSDFEPVLRGKKYLSMDFGGQFQEEIDIKFIFIKGTPARIPLSIQQVWPVEQRGYGEINDQRAYETRSIKIPANVKTAKLRSVISGHGQEGEFIPQQHTVSLNNGQKNFTWQVWKNCGDNPVYPQGGTWPEDRAGWCPGMATDLHEENLTPYITAGQDLTLRYSVATPGGDSRYIANHQLVTYADAKFTTDASLERITKPSQNVEFGRVNPACTTPTVIIKNNGTATLNSVRIQYSVSGTPLEYLWTGSLGFLQSTEVSLPISNLSFWGSSTTGKFTAIITQANGSSDEYAGNNTQVNEFTMPPVYGNKLLLNYKTNLYPQENSYTIKDIAGNVVVQKSNFTASKVYNDTISLPEGCYQLEFLDSGDDGLYYWYYEQVGPSHGVGYFKVKDLVLNKTKTYEPEFGGRIRQEFTVSNSVGISELDVNRDFTIYPNPTNGRIINVAFSGNAAESLRVYDSMGKEISVRTVLQNNVVKVTMNDLPAGVYFLAIPDTDGKITMNKVVLL